MGDINGWIFHKFLFHNFFLSTHSTANRAKTWTNSKLKEEITKAANQTYFDSFLKLIHVLDCEFFTFTRIWIFLYLLLILEEGRKEGGWGRQTERERERERERETLICCSTYFAFIRWFLYVPWPGIEPATLAYWDDVLTNRTTWPGHIFSIFTYSTSNITNLWDWIKDI